MDSTEKQKLLEAVKDLRLGWSFTYQEDNHPQHLASATMEELFENTYLCCNGPVIVQT